MSWFKSNQPLLCVSASHYASREQSKSHSTSRLQYEAWDFILEHCNIMQGSCSVQVGQCNGIHMTCLPTSHRIDAREQSLHTVWYAVRGAAHGDDH